MYARTLSEPDVTLPHLPVEPDLFGRVLWNYYHGQVGEYFLRRDDNYLERDNAARFFHGWSEMPAHHRCLLSHARERILDIGAGAGAHALALQERGLAVTAIDSSPLAVEVCRARGVQDARVLDAQQLASLDETFATVLLMGNTLGIAGTPEGLRELLLTLHTLVSPDGQILVDIHDACASRESAHLRYQAMNTACGRYPGAIRQRIEYQGACGPEFAWLLISLTELRDVCRETGWKIGRCVQVDREATYAIGIFRQ